MLKRWKPNCWNGDFSWDRIRGYSRSFEVGSFEIRVSGQEFESAALAEPIGLELGVGGGGRTGAGDGDEESPGIGERRCVLLDVAAQAAADQVAVVGFLRGALAGDESGADGGEGGIWQGADNDKPACFRVAGFSDAEEILRLRDAA